MTAAKFPKPCPFVTPAVRLRNAVEIAGAVRLNEIKLIPTKWLWPGIIPLGRVTLLTGDPGAGKSLLTLDIAARVSKGEAWPAAEGERGRRGGERENPPPALQQISPSPNLPLSPSSIPPASVLILTSEDDLADTVRPRLEAAGADCKNILAIPSVPGEHAGDAPRPFALNRDFKRLVNLLDAMPNCRLVIIDPISSFLGATNEHVNADVRATLAALTTIARERNIAVLAVGHLRKQEGPAIHRTIGSLAFVASARAVWLVTKDPNDETKRLLLPVKNNLASHTTGRAFTIVAPNQNAAPTLEWSSEPVKVTADTLPNIGRSMGRPNEERQYAIDWLKQHLANGPIAALEVRREADVHGISYGTLRRAFRHLDGQAVRQGVYPLATWYWKLPRIDAQNCPPDFCASIGIPDDLDKTFKQWMPKAKPAAQSTDQIVPPRTPPAYTMPDPVAKE